MEENKMRKTNETVDIVRERETDCPANIKKEEISSHKIK